jgi:phenylalanyl-tRNA synthetase beta chain
MKVPLSWLAEYIDFKLSPDELAGRLTLGGFSVDAVDEVEGEKVLTVDVPSNRPDCLGLIGIAREVAWLTEGVFKSPEIELDEVDTTEQIEVIVEAPDLCPRYTARIVTGVQVGPSPDWLQKRLIAAGLRPISNVVDVTNYVLMEYGQPLHAFDASKLRGAKIIIRRARSTEELLAIDGKRYSLSPDMLVIADTTDPVALAGIIGGKESEVSEQTTSVVIESAYFLPSKIMRTSKLLGISTESSYRFSRGVQWEGVETASHRAASLMKEIASASVTRVWVDKSLPPPEERKIALRPSRVQRVLGLTIERERLQSIFTLGGFRLDRSQGDLLELAIPSYRNDIQAEIDLIEEVARIYGYPRIPSIADCPVRLTSEERGEILEGRVRDLLCRVGLQEVLTTSFADPDIRTDFTTWSEGPAIRLLNPRGKGGKILRKSLSQSFLEVFKINEAYREEPRDIFEIAKIYYRSESFEEHQVLGVASLKGITYLKGIIEYLCQELSCKLSWRQSSHPLFEPFQSLLIELNSAPAGYLGTLARSVCEDYKVHSEVSVVEIKWERLVESSSLTKSFKEFSRFPAVKRDLAVIVEEGIKWEDLHTLVTQCGPEFLEEVRFFDLYRGSGIPEGKKSIAFSLIFRTHSRTLSHSEVDEAISTIVDILRQRLGAILRDKVDPRS